MPSMKIGLQEWPRIWDYRDWAYNQVYNNHCSWEAILDIRGIGDSLELVSAGDIEVHLLVPYVHG